MADLTGMLAERHRRRTLARFLTTPESGEASFLRKPAPEPELFRATIGACDACANRHTIVHRLEPSPEHVRLLMCQCDEDYGERVALTGLMICGPHLHGLLGDLEVVVGAPVECERESNPDLLPSERNCRIAWWLGERGHLPWLCPTCWRRLTEDEAEHLARPAEH